MGINIGVLSIGLRAFSLPDSDEEIKVMKAEQMKKKLQCFMLVKRTYRKQGYSLSYLDIFNYISSAVFYVPTTKGRGVSSVISVVEDSLTKGLPLDSIYQREADDLRGKKGNIAEVGRFASSGGTAGLMSEVWDLMSRVLEYSIENCIECLCITVNPAHVRFYRHIGFVPMGEVKNHPGVNAPAVLMVVNVNEWLEERGFKSLIAPQVSLPRVD
jgi:hypothetical protein